MLSGWSERSKDAWRLTLLALFFALCASCTGPGLEPPNDLAGAQPDASAPEGGNDAASGGTGGFGVGEGGAGGMSAGGSGGNGMGGVGGLGGADSPDAGDADEDAGTELGP